MQIAIAFLVGLILLILGLVRKSKLLKIVGGVLMLLAFAAVLFLMLVLLPAM